MKFWREVFVGLKQHEDVVIVEPFLLQIGKDGLSYIEEKEDMKFLEDKIPSYLHTKIQKLLKEG